MRRWTCFLLIIIWYHFWYRRTIWIAWERTTQLRPSRKWPKQQTTSQPATSSAKKSDLAWTGNSSPTWHSTQQSYLARLQPFTWGGPNSRSGSPSIPPNEKERGRQEKSGWSYHYKQWLPGIPCCLTMCPIWWGWSIRQWTRVARRGLIRLLR